MWLALLVTTTISLNRIIAQREEPSKAAVDHLAMSEAPVGESLAQTTADSIYGADRAEASEDQPIDSAHLLATESLPIEATVRKEESSVGNAYEQYDAFRETAPVLTPWATTTKIDEAANPIEIESVHQPIVPSGWLVAIRLALISFMATSWFLSRTYSTTLFLILGLATAAIALEPPHAEKQDRVRWIPVTLAVNALAIIIIYFSVRLRH